MLKAQQKAKEAAEAAEDEARFVNKSVWGRLVLWRSLLLATGSKKGPGIFFIHTLLHSFLLLLHPGLRFNAQQEELKKQFDKERRKETGEGGKGDERDDQREREMSEMSFFVEIHHLLVFQRSLVGVGRTGKILVSFR